MMGSQTSGQDRLFYSFNLDDHVPPNHLLRGIDRFLDLDELREHLAPFYSHTGRPSIDPELMIRMLIVGYCFGIRSERRLCEEVHLNLAYRWFCRLGLEDQVPDHSTFSKNRHGRFRDSDALRHVFEAVLRRCMSEGLVGGEGFAIDASVIKADANRARGIVAASPLTGAQVKRRRAVREYLEALDASAPEEQSAAMPKRISLTDPAARWTAAPGGPAFYAYSTNYLIDLRAGIIVDVEATPAHRTQEVESTKTMIDRVEQRLQLKPHRLVGDTAYGTAAMLGWMVEEKAHRAACAGLGQDRSARTTRSRAATSSGTKQPMSTAVRRDTRFAATGARSRSRTIPSPRTTRSSTDPARRLLELPAQAAMLPEHADPADHAQHPRSRTRCRAQDRNDAEYRRSRRERKKVEMLFATLKRILKLDRLRLRGLSGAQDEFLLAATAQNLRRMAKWLTLDPERLGMAAA